MQPERREAYRAGAERLAAQTGSATPETIFRIADELLAVARVLAREPRLRRALAEPARSGEDRVGLLRGVLAGKVDEGTLDVVAALVAARWPSSIDLLNTIERLAVDALLTIADQDDELSDVEDELFRFGQVVDGTPELAAALGDASVDAARRVGLARDLLAGKARPVTVRLVEVALSGFGGRTFAGALTRLVELAATRRERQVAYVTSAVPLSDDEEQRLGDRLSRMYGRLVSLKITVDPEIIGGLSVQVGDDLYDGTVRRRLNQARAAMTR